MRISDVAHVSAELQHSLHLLEAELARIDVLIGYELQRWQTAGRDPTDAFSGLHVSDVEAERWLRRPVSTSWGQTVALAEEEAEAFQTTYEQADRRVESVLAASHADDVIPRFEHLIAAFDLDGFERNALLICLAPALDRRYERLYGYLQDDVTRTWPTVGLILDLIAEPGVARLPLASRFTDAAPLRRYRLIEPVGDRPDESSTMAQAFRPAPTVVEWLLGTYFPPEELHRHSRLLAPTKNETDLLASGERWAELVDCAQGQSLAAFYGPDRRAQEAVALLIAESGDRPLLRVDLAAAIRAGTTPRRVLRLALRDARMTNAVTCIVGWEACLDGTTPPEDLVELLCTHPDLVILCSRQEWHPPDVARDRHVLWLSFPLPSYEQRERLWHFFLDEVETVDGLDVTAVAGQFELTTAQIQAAVALARDRAVQQQTPVDTDTLFAAIRTHSSSNLATLARKIEPRYTWDDIVLPDDQRSMLRELVDTVRGRPTVLDTWGVGQKLTASRGVAALFAGPPGTGKTMAAEVIAGELGLDLYKIDLSSVVSKYIGETEKNLERIFDEAENSNAILFFDEADAIFGKRSEVRDSHDRYANIEVSYLLQRMEAYDGVSILATNLRANLDEAFTRRLQFAIDFPFPEKEYREQIWETLFPPDVPRDTEIDFAGLAERFKLAGGNIRNVIVGAAYLAAGDGGTVTMKHLLHSTRRELQKMGRLVAEQDLRLDDE